MSTVLHISAAGPVWWEKTAAGWGSASGPGQGPVWVVTDLAEGGYQASDMLRYNVLQLAQALEQT